MCIRDSQPHCDADELEDVSVGHGDHLPHHGVQDGDACGDQDGHLHTHTYHHAQAGAWSTNRHTVRLNTAMGTNVSMISNIGSNCLYGRQHRVRLSLWWTQTHGQA